MTRTFFSSFASALAASRSPAVRAAARPEPADLELLALPPSAAAVGGAMTSAAPSPLPATVQPVDPAMFWDWPELGNNQIPSQQFSFCDTQPASSEPGAPFSSGGSSFSDGYFDFLQLVPPNFRPASLLAAARAAATPPTLAPSAGVGPPGWLVVPDSGGVLRWRPEWQVSLTPQAWRRDESGAPFSWSAEGASGFLEAPFDVATKSATVSVDQLTRVAVYPGAWYSDAFVGIAASLPRLVGNRPVAAILGPRGILRGRISEFFVGSGLRASVVVTPSVASALHAQLSASTVARLGPVAAPADALKVTSLGDGVRFDAALQAQTPCILGVTVVPIQAAT